MKYTEKFIATDSVGERQARREAVVEIDDLSPVLLLEWAKERIDQGRYRQSIEDDKENEVEQ